MYDSRAAQVSNGGPVQATRLPAVRFGHRSAPGMPGRAKNRTSEPHTPAMATHPYHLALRIKARLPQTKVYFDADPAHFRELDTLLTLVGLGVGLVPYALDPDDLFTAISSVVAGAAIGYLATLWRRARVRERRKLLLAPALAEIEALEREHPQVLRTLSARLGKRVSHDKRLAGELARYHELLRDPDRYFALLEALVRRLELTEGEPALAT